MKHYLNVCDVNGAEVEPVDAVVFGSPCQDLSVAGLRRGLKHESNGDDETTRSGLFMEAVRIIKEMRYEDELGKLQSGRTDEHIRPRFAVWENVPGAFSSNKGEDFRVVLEELARVKDEEVSIPMPKNGKWQTAGEIVGDGWSIAWRTLDAQYHGVPQRRRRIFLVADFADECAGEILFECEGLPGYPSESCEEGQGTPGDIEGCTRGASEGECIGFDAYQHHGWKQSETLGTLTVGSCSGVRGDTPLICSPYTLQIRSGCEPIGIDGYNQEITENVTQTLTAQRVDASNIPLVIEPKCYTMQAIGEYKDCDCASSLKMRDYKDATDLVCEPNVSQAVCYQEKVGALCARDYKGIGSQYVEEDKCIVEKGVKHIVRRLTPTECARLQGMPDAWCRLSQIEDMSDEDYEFWKQAHKVDAEIKGKAYREKTKAQMIKWYNGLQADGSEYKAYGNGMALPCVRVPIHGIAKHGARTMASLFDGIGGFPLAGLIDGIETLWTSEIELFPIAVTKERFEEYEKYGGFTFGAERSRHENKLHQTR